MHRYRFKLYSNYQLTCVFPARGYLCIFLVGVGSLYMGHACVTGAHLNCGGPSCILHLVLYALSPNVSLAGGTFQFGMWVGGWVAGDDVLHVTLIRLLSVISLSLLFGAFVCRRHPRDV